MLLHVQPAKHLNIGESHSGNTTTLKFVTKSSHDHKNFCRVIMHYWPRTEQ